MVKSYIDNDSTSDILPERLFSWFLPLPFLVLSISNFENTP